MGEEERGRESQENIPKWQAIYDNIFLLFLLGAVILVVSYTLWGIMEVANVAMWNP